MGYPTSAESSQSHLPQTPPDFTPYSSARYNAHHLPPKDLSWPHPKPPISPPMSSHDQPPSRLAKLPSPMRPSSSASASASSSMPTVCVSASPASSPRKNDAQRPPVRETLPSLSSIFGPPENIRPLHPSPLERPRADASTPTGPPMSLPQDQRHSPSSLSYCPTAATPPALPQPPRSVYQDEHSPRQESAPRQWSDLRSNYAAASRWASHHDSSSSSRSERASYSEQKPYYAEPYAQAPSPTDARGPALADYHRRHHEQPLSYAPHRDHHQYSPPPPPHMGHPHSPVRGPGSAASMPPTPSASVAASAYPEGATIPKDGMGPKIWTGVDFLPQFMRAADVPGEGLCYFYDDGSHCKAVIDGETVNPYWGVTKAGKPRKRLAIACMTCREKKIKCDPEYPRCVQCEKFGRVCRFKNAPRGGNNVSPGTTSSEPETMRKIGSVSLIRPPPESPRAGMRRPSSPDRMDAAGAGAYKRVRTDYDHYTTTSRGRSPPYGNVSPPSSAEAPRASSALPRAPWSHDARYAPSPYPSQSQSQSPYHHAQPPYQRHYDDYRRSSQPVSPQETEPARTLLPPPPRAGPELPRIHGDGMDRPWQHGRA